MAKHDIEITPAERDELIARARKLAERFAELGPAADEKNELPLELVPLYKERGLARLIVPKKYGGFGADLWTVALVENELASLRDPEITLSFNKDRQRVVYGQSVSVSVALGCSRHIKKKKK